MSESTEPSEIRDRAIQIIAGAISECCHPTLTAEDCRGNAIAILARLRMDGLEVSEKNGESTA